MIKAVIFDMDGVISDTQNLHSQIESDILGHYGVNISPDEITSRYAGMTTKVFFRDLLKEMDEKKIDALMDEKWNKMYELAKAGVKPIRGVIEIINELKAKKIKLGVASASGMSYVLTVLEALGIKSVFDAITSADEVEKGKPEPDIFILTARKLGVDAHFCVVIEDGINGMLAAKKAEMKCIALASDINKDYPADKKIGSFSDIDAKFIINI